MSNGVDKETWDEDLSEHTKLNILYKEVCKINRKLSWKTGAIVGGLIIGMSVFLSVIICSQESPVGIITGILKALT